MRNEIVKLIVELQQTLLQSENPGVKAMCCLLLTRLQKILDVNPDPPVRHVDTFVESGFPAGPFEPKVDRETGLDENGKQYLFE